ncbi:hypothetical protein BC826DRAFT_969468 [Russula brevipes]|nr:hypothetical protein BC826DRAFT_969468 [Russula brevipes]
MEGMVRALHICWIAGYKWVPKVERIRGMASAAVLMIPRFAGRSEYPSITTASTSTSSFLISGVVTRRQWRLPYSESDAGVEFTTFSLGRPTLLAHGIAHATQTRKREQARRLLRKINVDTGPRAAETAYRWFSPGQAHEAALRHLSGFERGLVQLLPNFIITASRRTPWVPEILESIAATTADTGFPSGRWLNSGKGKSCCARPITVQKGTEIWCGFQLIETAEERKALEYASVDYMTNYQNQGPVTGSRTIEKIVIQEQKVSRWAFKKVQLAK